LSASTFGSERQKKAEATLAVSAVNEKQTIFYEIVFADTAFMAETAFIADTAFIAETAFMAETAFIAEVAFIAVTVLLGAGAALTDLVLAGLLADFVLVMDFLMTAMGGS
jgi:UDP-3-O-[3-hydroxymyristoyl] glucosamine N-acyltransferase